MREIKTGRKTWFLLALFFCLTLFWGKTDVFAAKTVNLTPNKWYKDKSLYNNQTVFHKVTASKDGCLVIDGYGYSRVRKGKFELPIQMYNRRKSAMQTQKINLNKQNGYRSYVGVKKGIYYIRVDDSLYKLKYKFMAVSDKSGSSRLQSRNLSKGKTMEGLLRLGENGKKSDWYKFRLKKARSVTFTFGSRSNGWVEFKILSDKQKLKDNSAYIYNKTQTGASAKLPKGTYYIQVKRQGNNKNTTGFYSLRWK